MACRCRGSSWSSAIPTKRILLSSDTAVVGITALSLLSVERLLLAVCSTERSYGLRVVWVDEPVVSVWCFLVTQRSRFCKMLGGDLTDSKALITFCEILQLCREECIPFTANPLRGSFKQAFVAHRQALKTLYFDVILEIYCEIT